MKSLLKIKNIFIYFLLFFSTFLDAVFETTINGPFEVEAGSELEIK